MPNKKLKTQKGNSCAAHCTVVAIADLLDVEHFLTNEYAESHLWPSIQFEDDGSPLVKHLAELENSDPRKIVKETESRWAEVKATLLCDETQKTTALKTVPKEVALQLDALFNMMKGDGSTTEIRPGAGIYYNASYLIFKNGTYAGLHNILVTNFNGQIHYYNPNEDDPGWSTTPDWSTLDKQNKESCKYVFTGVCVEFKKR